MENKPLKYHDVLPIDRRDLEKMVESGNEDAIVTALLSAAYYEPEWRWVQGLCLRFLDDPSKNVRCNAATCLGHLARIHRVLDVDLVLAKLIPLKNDSLIGPRVEDALDDIKLFVQNV